MKKQREYKELVKDCGQVGWNSEKQDGMTIYCCLRHAEQLANAGNNAKNKKISKSDPT